MRVRLRELVAYVDRCAEEWLGYDLPPHGGQALLEQLRQDPATAHLPVVVLTDSATASASR